MKAKKKLLIVSVICCAVVLIIAVIYTMQNQKNDDGNHRISVSGASSAVFEYCEDDGYKLFTSEISTLYSFDSLQIMPTDEEFTGEWIYRITFNPEEYADNTDEITVVFGRENLTVNGKTYKAAENVNYQDILNWARDKYEYFDYELLHF